MKNVVYIAMSADLIHTGHLNIIKEGAKYGEVVVGVLTNKAIASYKRLPFLDFEERSEIVSNIKNVSRVIAQNTLDYTDNILKLKPMYVVHGDDWKEGIQKKTRTKVKELLSAWGGVLIEVPYTQGISSTKINKAINSKGIDPIRRLRNFKRLLSAKDMIRGIESHSGITGVIIEEEHIYEDNVKREFDFLWSSSLTDSTLRAKPDIEALDHSSRINWLSSIMEVTTKPIVYDGDTGGKIEHIPFLIRNLERIGVSAIIVEDKKGLKVNSLFGVEKKQEQETIENFGEKIKTAQKSKIQDDFMFISRIESLIAGKSVKDALDRAHSYVEYGTDGIMIHSKEKSGEDIKEFCSLFRKKDDITPIVLVPSSYNHIKEEELLEMGANVVIYANHLMRASIPAMKSVAKNILINHRSLEVNDECMPIKEIIELF